MDLEPKNIDGSDLANKEIDAARRILGGSEFSIQDLDQTVTDPDRIKEIEAMFDNDVAPLPTGWTYLVHGTSADRWDADMDEVVVGGFGGLSAISKEDAIKTAKRGFSSTTDGYSRSRGAQSSPLEIRIVYPSESMSRRRVALGQDVDVKANLSKEIIDLATKTYQDRHPKIPRHQVLVKLGESLGKNGRAVIYYIPASLVDCYMQSMRPETELI